MANEDFGAGIDRLTALIPEDLHALVDLAKVASVVGWGTLFNVVDYTRGIRALHDAGCCSAALPLLRSAVEYTMATIWLADEGDEAVEVLNRATVHTHRKLYGHLDGVDWRSKFSDDLINNFESVVNTEFDPHPDQTLSHFTHLLEAYGFEKEISVYDVLSMASHATSTGAQRYFRQTDTAFLVTQQIEPPESIGPCEMWAFGLLLDAMIHYNELLIGKPWTDELKSIAADLGYPARLVKRKPKAEKRKQRTGDRRG